MGSAIAARILSSIANWERGQYSHLQFRYLYDHAYSIVLEAGAERLSMGKPIHLRADLLHLERVMASK